jgi:uncharacterized protein (TIGR04255 family)
MTRNRLPNSPLAQVSCEIRFHGELALYEAWGRFQREVRAEFPKLFVPVAAHGVPPLTQPAKLASMDGADSLLLAINSFAYSTAQYQDFPIFRKKFLRILDIFVRQAALTDLTRFGLRYINILPPSGDDGMPENRIHPCLTLELTGLRTPAGHWTNQPQIVVERAVGRFTLRAALLAAVPVGFPEGAGMSSAPGLLPGVQLDFDCYLNNPGPTQGVAALLDGAHEAIDATFFGMITSEYHSYLKGSADG